MKHLTILTLGIITLFSLACQQKEPKSIQTKVEVTKDEVKEDPNKIIFEN